MCECRIRITSMLNRELVVRILKNASEVRWLFVIVATCLGLVTMFVVPPLWGFDETSHFSRVYLLSRGNFLSAQKAEMPLSYNQVSRYATANIGQPKQPNIFLRKDIDNASEYHKLLGMKFSKQTQQAINPAGYPFFAYPLSVVFVAIAAPFNLSIGINTILARLAGLVTFVLLVYMALYVLNKNNFKKTQWIFFVVSLLPTTLFQAATLSADTVVNGLSILFIALLLVIIEKQSKEVTKHKVNKWYLASLLTIAVILPLIKVNYIFLSLGTLLISNQLLGGKTLGILSKTLLAIVPTLLSLFLTFGMTPSGAGSHQVSPRPDGLPIDPKGQILFIIGHPLSLIWAFVKSLIYYGDTYLKEMTTVLAWNYVELPIIFTLFCVTLILLAAFYSKDEFRYIKRYLNIMTLFLLCGIGSIFLALYIEFTPVGKILIDGVQGRYLIPFIIPAALALAVNLDIGILIRERLMRNIMTISIGALLIGSILYYAKATY